MARVHKTPTTIFLVTSAIPLIPGAGLYRTVSALMLRHTAEATVQGTYTLLFAASMASGWVFPAAPTSTSRAPGLLSWLNRWERRLM